MNAAQTARWHRFARDRYAVMLLTALVGAVLLWSFRGNIGALALRDPDDALRLVQIRDWIAGQSGFDVTQYRINPPGGGAMHWSRLIDAPIAALMLALRPLLGAAAAERVVMALYPLGLIGIFLALLAATLRKLGGRALVWSGLVIACTCVTILYQFTPLRIDHHGVQIILALALLRLLLAQPSARSGLFAGLAIAADLTISLESLPYLLLFGGLFALAWLREAAHGRRLVAFVATLAVAGPVLLAATRGVGDLASLWCDSWSRPWMLATMVAALVLVAGQAIPALHRDWRARLVLLALAGGAGAATMALDGGLCLAGPFADLDPLVRHYWYDNVLEGRPIWRQDAGIAAMLVMPSLLGLLATAMAWRVCATDLKPRWAELLLALAASFILSLLVMRTTSVTHMFALPGLAWAGVAAWQWARAQSSALVRIMASLAVILVLPPVSGQAAALAAKALFPGEKPAAMANLPDRDQFRQCLTARRLAPLAEMLPETIFAPLDLGPHLLVHTPHRVIATSHHRNSDAMARVIGGFVADADRAEFLVRSTGSTLVAVCAATPEMRNLGGKLPNSLAARLEAGTPPPWLVPVPLPAGGTLQLYRVIPED